MGLRLWYRKRKGFPFHVIPKRKIRDKKAAEAAEEFLRWNEERIEKMTRKRILGYMTTDQEDRGEN